MRIINDTHFRHRRFRCLNTKRASLRTIRRQKHKELHSPHINSFDPPISNLDYGARRRGCFEVDSFAILNLTFNVHTHTSTIQTTIGPTARVNTAWQFILQEISALVKTPANALCPTTIHSVNPRWNSLIRLNTWTVLGIIVFNNRLSMPSLLTVIV